MTQTNPIKPEVSAMKNCHISVPVGKMSKNDDAVTARRKALAEALRSGVDVVVTPSGEVGFKEEAEEQGQTAIKVPDGKLANGRA